MKIFITVKPNSKKEKVEKIDEAHFRVWVKEPPKVGKANEAVIRKMADYLGISKSALTIVSGASSRQKIIKITK
jgi:hypothetical protein